ncbi:COG1361 family protein [Natronospora cellulosivora (SeqCode)]
MKKIIFLIVLIVLTSFVIYADSNLFYETDHNNNLRLGNDYIVIIVNQDDNAQGRFAVETTGGAPLNNNDMNKPLIFGRPKPWASYSTIWLNGEHYVFGGETGRRAGAGQKYGEVIQDPYVQDNSVITTTQFGDNLIVEQILTLVKSSTTGLEDTAQIKYRLKNTSQENQKVGLRVVLDTMLGENDGAPFRIGDEAVTTDRLYYRSQLPEFWLSFDSLSNPTVTSQGTFKGEGVTPPDQVKLGDWGSMADGVWDFDFNPGDEFIRKGEFEIDSAIALYWVPEILEPGETITYITNYGLGGISVVPGLLSLGVTSPAEVVFNSPDIRIPVVAYVENTSEILARNVRVSIELPDSLEVDSFERKVGDLEAGEISQVTWDIKLSDLSLSPLVNYTVKVEAENTDSNQVTRDIKFIGPPNLETKVSLADDLYLEDGKLMPNPFSIETELYNSGESTLYDVSLELLLPPGLILAPRERIKKYAGDIAANESMNIRWRVEALNIDGQLPFALDIKALHGYQELKQYENLILPEREPILFFRAPSNMNIEENQYITIDLRAENFYDIDLADIIINYDSDILRAVHVSRGNIFIKDNNYLPWKRADLSQSGIIRLDQLIPSNVGGGTLATIHLMVLENKDFTLEIDKDSSFIGYDGNVKVELNNYDY